MAMILWHYYISFSAGVSSTSLLLTLMTRVSQKLMGLVPAVFSIYDLRM